LASLYLDHNVSLQIVSPLRSFGHTVRTARDLGRERLHDDAQLLAAAQSGDILITHNRRDLTMLHDAWLTWAAAFDVINNRLERATGKTLLSTQAWNAHDWTLK
jgi:hypothetical protein